MRLSSFLPPSFVFSLTWRSVGFWEESRALAAVEALTSRLTVEARTLRDGAWVLVPARELVPGDVIRLRAGDLVSANAVLLAGGAGLEMDESALTGESLPRTRRAGDALLSASLVRRGEGVAVVTATGAHTLYGKTVQLVSSARSQMHAEVVTGRVAFVLVAATLVVACAVVAVVVARKQDLVAVLPNIVLIVVTGLPSALPAMFALTMAFGTQELAGRGVLVTSLEATEDSARMTVLAADKTGTITENKLALAGAKAVPGAGLGGPAGVLFAAALASAEANHDAIDAVMLVAARAGTGEEGARQLAGAEWRVESFSPFDPSTRRTEAVVVHVRTGRRMRCVKGALKSVLPLCTAGGGGGPTLDAWAQAADAQFAALGCRSLAVACSDAEPLRAELPPPPPPPPPPGIGNSDEAQQLPLPSPPFEDAAALAAAATAPVYLLGVIGLRDPPRKDSAASIAALRDLGISTLMVTGDATRVARTVAREVGLGAAPAFLSLAAWREDQVVAAAAAAGTGSAGVAATLDAAAAAYTGEGSLAGDAALLDAVQTADGFAEVYPHEKHLIVRALQELDVVVGMTGDGINDAPALAQAEVGVAVSNATDAAKKAARVVLLNDGLSGIVDLVRVSRTIHARIETWVLNKTAKEFIMVFFIVGMYFYTGTWVIGAFQMGLLLLLIDFVTLSIAADSAPGAAQPQTWEILPLFVLGALTGAVGFLGCISLIALAVAVLGYTLADPRLGTLALEIIFFTSAGNIFSVRERRWFWSSRPGWALLGFVLADSVVIITLATVGVPEMPAIPISHSAIAVVWAAVWALGAVDLAKAAFYSSCRCWPACCGDGSRRRGSTSSGSRRTIALLCSCCSQRPSLPAQYVGGGKGASAGSPGFVATTAEERGFGATDRLLVKSV